MSKTLVVLEDEDATVNGAHQAFDENLLREGPQRSQLLQRRTQRLWPAFHLRKRAAVVWQRVPDTGVIGTLRNLLVVRSLLCEHGEQLAHGIRGPSDGT